MKNPEWLTDIIYLWETIGGPNTIGNVADDAVPRMPTRDSILLLLAYIKELREALGEAIQATGSDPMWDVLDARALLSRDTPPEVSE